MPVDLIVQLRPGVELETRRRAFRIPRMPPAVWPIAGFALFTFGLLASLLLPGSALGSTERWASLVFGAVTVGAWLGGRQAGSFRTGRGQGVLIGSTCVVLVDHRRVEVIPAEKLAIEGLSILCDGKLVHRERFESPLLDDARKAIETATDDPGARERDRWRMAGAAARDRAGQDRGTAPWGPVVMGTAAFSLAAGFVAFGPGQGPSPAAGWARIEPRRDAMVAALHDLQTGSSQRLLDLATTSEALRGLMIHARKEQWAEGRRSAMQARYLTLARAELAKLTGSKAVARYLDDADNFELPDDFRRLALSRFESLAGAELAAGPGVDDAERIRATAEQHGASEGLKARAQEVLEARLLAEVDQPELGAERLLQLIASAEQWRVGAAAERATGQLHSALKRVNDVHQAVALAGLIEELGVDHGTVQAEVLKVVDERVRAHLRRVRVLDDVIWLTQVEATLANRTRDEIGKAYADVARRTAQRAENMDDLDTLMAELDDDALSEGQLAGLEKEVSRRYAHLASKRLREIEDLEGASDFLRESRRRGVEEVTEKAQELYDKLAFRAAERGGLAEVRDYLTDPQVEDQDKRARIEARLATLCRDRVPLGDNPLVRLLRVMCMEDKSVLTYELTGHDNGLDRQAIDALIEFLNTLTEETRNPLVVTAAPTPSQPMIAVRVEGDGDSDEWPCTIRVVMKHPALAGVQWSEATTCTTTHTTVPRWMR